MSSDEGTLRTVMSGHGVTGMTEGWEERDHCERHDMIIRQRTQLRGICGWVAAAFPQLLRPHGAHLTGEIPSRSSCASLREAQTQS